MVDTRYARRILTAFFVGILVFGGTPFLRATAWSAPVLPSVLKHLPREYANPVSPNVLLLLDTSGSMSFRMLNDGRTWGDGSHPWKYGDAWQIYYGRDYNSDNNDVGDDPKKRYNYYPPCTYQYRAPADDPSGPLQKTENLVPNDSRLYNLKKVLWYIFTDPSLVEGLNVGLATYDQRNDTEQAHWYRWPAASSGNRCYTTWQSRARRARLRVPFGRILPFNYDEADFQRGVPDALVNSSQWYKILSLLDGWETSRNPELRASSGTPLADSIFLEGSQETATKYLESAIQYPCQQSWLIALTDGADSYTSTPQDAVKSAYSAYTSWNTPYGSVEQPIRTFVIGLTRNSNLMKKLHDMAYEGRVWEVDSSIPENAAAFQASDTQSLLEAFRAIFKTIKKSGASSGSAPLVNAQKLNNLEDVVYSLSCVPLADGAWPGNLHKKSYVKKSNDKYEFEEVWNAEAKIRALGWHDREIYYPRWLVGGGPTVQNLSSFSESDAGTIAQAAGVPASQADAFVRWVRGGNWTDSSTSSTRSHPMLDAYRGGLLRLGPPPGIRADEDFSQFALNHLDRQTVIFSQGNGGILHCFDDDDGSEVWGIVPPNVLHDGRIKGLIGSPGAENDGRSIFLLAGPLVAEDVKSDTAGYRTLLLGSLGYGGCGLYALDVTKPADPMFLWARDSSVYDGNNFTAANADLWWSGSSLGASLTQGSSVPGTNRLPYLRRVIGSPFIGWLGNPGNTPRWVVFFGAGAGLKTPPQSDGSIDFLHSGDQGGRAVYAVRADDGSLEAAFTHSDMGEVIATPSVLAQTTLGSYLKIGTAYVGDSRGQVWRITPESETVKKMADLGSGASSRPPLVQQVDLGRDVAGNLWVFGATGDDQGLCVRGATSPSNVLFAFPESDDKVMRRADLEELEGSASVPGAVKKGWYLSLASNEAVTAKPKLHRGLYVAATFREDPSGNPCNPGASRLYFMEAFSGDGKWQSGARYHEISGIKITSIQAEGNKVYLGVENPSGKKVEQGDEVLKEKKATTDPSGAVISMELPELPPPAAESLLLRSLYWQRFR